MHFDMKHHLHFHALLENLPMTIFKLPPQISIPYVKVGSTKALNRWDLSSHHVTLTIVLSLKCPYMQIFAF